MANQFGQGFSDAGLKNPAAVAIITTPNQALYTALAQYVSAPSGQTPFGSATEIFKEPMPTSGAAQLQVGLTSTSDVFGSIIRYNLPQDQKAGDQWTGDPGIYINVYRVEAATLAPTTFSTQSLTKQSFNTNETTQSFQADLAELSNLLIPYVSQASNNDTYVAVPVTAGGFDSFQCIIYGRYCQGGTEDNDSYRIFNVGTLPAGSYTIVLGVLHSTSPGDPNAPANPLNNARYTSVSWSDTLIDPFGISENEGINSPAQQANVTASGFKSPASLYGSAQQLLVNTGLYSSASAQLKADLPNLYAVVLERSTTNCNNALCSTAPSSYYVNVIQNLSPPEGVPLTDPFSVTERAYLLPGTGTASFTGAAAADLVGPTILCDQTVNANCN